MIQIKGYYNRKLENLIETSPQFSEDTTVDRTNLQKLILISNIMVMTQLIMIIFCVSYFTGMIWYLISELALAKLDEQENFITYFEIDDRENIDKMFALLYFSFTSLSTVGLGDYHPRSDRERIQGAFILLFGVAITSYVIE